MVTGVGQKLVNMAIGFISRKIFIVYLGMAYVGLNALFSNVLSLLSLAELGLGSAITVYLYKPLAGKDEEEIRTYMHFYKKCYRYIGAAILVMGLCLVPALPYMVNFDNSETPDVNLYLVYLLFLANSVAIVVYEALRQQGFPGLSGEGSLTGRDDAAAPWMDYL